jgi:hypothetical protein
MPLIASYGILGIMEPETKRLAALKEELLKDMEALERVERLMAAKNGLLSRPDDRQLTLPIRPLTARREATDKAVDSAEEDADQPVLSLRGKIEEAVNTNPEMRWTTQKVLAHLQAIGFPLRAQKPIYSVGQALQKLAEGKKIRIVRRGVGSAPNIYKGIASAQNQDSQTEGDSQGGNIGVESTSAE